MPAAPIITVRLYRTSAPDVTVYQIAMPEAEGLPFANFVAGQLLDAMADASGDDFGYKVATAALHDGPPALGPMLRAVALLVSPPPSPNAPPCRVERQGDEIFCSTCTRRWDADEEPPCPRVDGQGRRTDG